MIDLSQLKNIEIVESAQISIEPGVTQAEYEIWKSENPSFQYTIPHGVSPLPAVGGLATGGGIGLTTRQWGVTTDYISGVRVILCDGSLWQIFENDETNTKCLEECDGDMDLDSDDLQELLYAIKGGGGETLALLPSIILTPWKTPISRSISNWSMMCQTEMPYSIRSLHSKT